MNDFRLQIVAVILAATPKSAENRKQNTIYRHSPANHSPNFTFPSSVNKIFAPYYL